MYFNGNYIKYTNIAKHLRHYISHDSHELCMHDVVKSVMVNTNGVVSMFGSAYTHVKYHFFKCFAVSLCGSV